MAVVRAVLDTNIYVSTLLSSLGVAGRILTAGFERSLNFDFCPVPVR